jgi:hypothetical protein
MRPRPKAVPPLEFSAYADLRPRRSKAEPVAITVDDEAADFRSNLSAGDDNAFFAWLGARILALEQAGGPLVGLPVERRGETQLWIDDKYRLQWSVNAEFNQLRLTATVQP